MLMISVAAATLAAVAPTADAVAIVTALSKCEIARLNSSAGGSPALIAIGASQKPSASSVYE